MTRAEVVRPYVEKLLKQHCGTDQLLVDDEGDVPIRRGSTMYWVTVFEQDHHAQVRVWSYVGRQVKPSAKLFKALNDINSAINYGRVYWESGDVVVAHELLADDLDMAELANACECVGSISDRFDDDLVAKFGGTVFFPEAQPGEDNDETEV